LLPTAAARKQEAVGVRRVGQRRQGAQGKNASRDAPDVVIDWYPTLGMEFAERDMKRPLVLIQLPEAIQRKVDTLTDTDSGGADE
jgi:hypothetical protein